MNTIFKGITIEEQEQLVEGVSWITVLIAGADGHIDSEELAWAEKIAEIRAYSLADQMYDFYQLVGINFDEKLQSIIKSTEGARDVRTQRCIEEIAKLDPILQKMEPEEAFKLLNSYRSFAKHVAKASGGFLRMWSISYEENQYINLPMLTPINYVPPVEPEETEE